MEKKLMVVCPYHPSEGRKHQMEGSQSTLYKKQHPVSKIIKENKLKVWHKQ
jgi:hypothetical protein